MKELTMSDRYKFAYGKVWEETSDKMKLIIKGVDTRPCFERGDCKSRAEEFAHKVAVFAERPYKELQRAACDAEKGLKVA